VPLTILKFAAGVTLPRRAYLDTNLIIDTRDAAARKYIPASTCFAELIRQGVQLNVSGLVFDELWWTYLRMSFRLATGTDLTPAVYKATPGIVQAHWPAVRAVMIAIRAWNGFNELPAPVGIVAQAEALMETNTLLPRDAFHLALVLHHGIESFVTADGDFDKLQLPAGTNLTLVKI